MTCSGTATNKARLRPIFPYTAEAYHSSNHFRYRADLCSTGRQGCCHGLQTYIQQAEATPNGTLHFVASMGEYFRDQWRMNHYHNINWPYKLRSLVHDETSWTKEECTEQYDKIDGEESQHQTSTTAKQIYIAVAYKERQWTRLPITWNKGTAGNALSGSTYRPQRLKLKKKCSESPNISLRGTETVKGGRQITKRESKYREREGYERTESLSHIKTKE